MNKVLFFCLRLSMLEKLIYIEYLYLPKVSCGNLKTFFFQKKMASFYHPMTKNFVKKGALNKKPKNGTSHAFISISNFLTKTDFF